METISESASTVQFDAAWVSAVTRVSAMAQAKLPEALHGRIQRGTALVLNGEVWFEDDGRTCQVRSNTGAWYTVNGACPCPCVAAAQQPEGYCKHKLAKMIYLRASDFLREVPASQGESVLDDTPPAPGKVPAQYITMLHGKPFIQFAGLLALAHERGLVSLKARFVSVTAELALAEAEATFADGKSYSECADSTPQNVGAQIKAHFPRMALTRAKARVLRDALNIGMCSIEELE